MAEVNGEKLALGAYTREHLLSNERAIIPQKDIFFGQLKKK